MKTICVAGTASGVGKTAVAEMLLRVLKGWTAAKVTPLHAGPCPRGKPCKCESPLGIVTRGAILAQPGTDTARYMAAGAKRVFWVCSPRRTMGSALRRMLRRLRPNENLLVEGNSFARAARPDVTILVAAAGRREMKASARAMLRKVDIVVLRADRGDTAQDVARAVKWWKARAKGRDIFVVRAFRRGNAGFVRCVVGRLGAAEQGTKGTAEK